MEVLVVVAIMGILATFVVIAYSKFNSMQALDKNMALVSSVLNQARSLTLASKDNTQYGVHFDADQIVLFAGSSYSESNPDNNAIALSVSVAVSASFLGGGSDVIFQRLTGETEQSGTVTLSLVSSPASVKSLTVFETGIIQHN